MTTRYQRSAAAPSPPVDIAILSPLGRSGTLIHGGITSVVTMLTRGLSDAGNRVELLTFAPSDPRALVQDLDERALIVNFGPGHRRAHLRKLRSYLDERRPRVLLAAGHRSNRLAIGCKRHGEPETRVFLSVHNMLTPGLASAGRISRWLRTREIRRIYPRADGVICVSAGVAADLARYALVPPARRSVIHNPVVWGALMRGAPAACPHPWLAPGQPPVILAAGRLAPQKDFGTLVRAFARLARETEYRLLIIGEGTERRALEQLAIELQLDDRIALPGFVPDPLSYMACARLFVLSSAWEGFGNVLVEAMAVGTPVVATDCQSGPREILRDGELGPLAPPGDPAALAEAIRAALAHPVAPEVLRRRAADFSVEHVARRYLDALFDARKRTA